MAEAGEAPPDHNLRNAFPRRSRKAPLFYYTLGTFLSIIAKDGGKYFFLGLLFSFAYQILPYFPYMNDYQPRLARSWPGKRPQTREEIFESLLRQNIANPNFTLRDAAQAMHASPRSLQRELQAADKSFRGELLRVRIEAAQRLLRLGKRTTQIAPLVGYRRREHFSRAFRRSCGQAPTDWQQAYSRSRKD